jgi:hypothetical protein
VLIVAIWGGLVVTTVCLSSSAGIEVRLCPFKYFTGLPCPTCGGTRGVLAIAGGHVLDGFGFNPLLFAVLVIVAADLLGRVIFARRLRLTASQRERKILWLSLLALIAINWAYLMLRGI